MLDNKTKEMVALSASIAGNCVPCLKYHFGESVKQGCTPQDIQEVLNIANMVKNRPISDIDKVSSELLKGLK